MVLVALLFNFVYFVLSVVKNKEIKKCSPRRKREERKKRFGYVKKVFYDPMQRFVAFVYFVLFVVKTEIERRTKNGIAE